MVCARGHRVVQWGSRVEVILRSGGRRVENKMRKQPAPPPLTDTFSRDMLWTTKYHSSWEYFLKTTSCHCRGRFISITSTLIVTSYHLGNHQLIQSSLFIITNQYR